MFRSELAGRTIGKESGDRYANESVDSVPDKVERGDLVGEELNDEKGNTGTDDDPALKRLQSSGKWEVAETREQSEDRDGGVKVKSRGKTDGYEKGEELRRRDFQNVEHWSDWSESSSIYYGALRRSTEQ